MKNQYIASILLTASLLLGAHAFGQSAFWVFFTDKSGVTFEPRSYFHAAAIERRIMNGLPECDSSDYPVREDYVAQISEMATETGYASRWFNALYIHATFEQLSQIQALPFVKEVMPVHSTLQLAASNASDSLEYFNKTHFQQINLMGGEDFMNRGIDGSGIRIAVFDAGFPQVDEHSAFNHIRESNRIAETFNFAKPKKDVYRSNSHGLSTLSNIGGVFNGQPLGLATGATFLLAVTEINIEILKEEHWWIAAAEWADKHGAHIINSSLGYGVDRYFPEEMNGNTTLITRAANKAAGKGILIVNSAGNEGDDRRWRIIGAPADGDSVLAVGGINPDNNNKIDFASFGPTPDGRKKPNVSASGKTMAAKKGDVVGINYGTSFSAPLVAGFAACAMQYLQGITAMELFAEIEQSASLYPYFDYGTGYGIPQAARIFERNPVIEETFEVLKKEGSLQFTILPDAMKNQRTNRFLGEEYLYYHLADDTDRLLHYEVLGVYSQTPLTIDISELLSAAKTLRVHYKGYTKTISLR